MNLEDVIDPEYGLQQDAFSEGRPRFGDKQQLEVIGWSGRSSSRQKYYILCCNICAQDAEVFGDGLFRSPKGCLVAGQVPCGCSKRPHWSEQQYSTLCYRASHGLGYEFIGWAETFNGGETKIDQFCSEHGVWSSGRIRHLLRLSQGCPGCRAEVVGTRSRKPDEAMILSFLASGQFHTETKFWRSTRLTSQGFATYWHVHCPECDSVGEAQSEELRRGCRPCLCSKFRQQQAYINWLVDNTNQAVALKFGIANNAKQRVKQQDRKCVYEVRQYLVYTFPTKKQCLAAERECKQTLPCAIISKDDMPDGYTETTYTYNLARIKAIYEKHGGKTSG
ncbi:hypothetical protein D3C84_679660 [compost metagenome]